MGWEGTSVVICQLLSVVKDGEIGALYRGGENSSEPPGSVMRDRETVIPRTG
jgi:hypothetical protein